MSSRLSKHGGILYIPSLDRSTERSVRDVKDLNSVKSKLMSISKLHVADELHLTFTPENFHSTVLGMIPNTESRYPKNQLNLLNTPSDWQKWVLSFRFFYQEVLFKTFTATKVTQDYYAHQQEGYYQAGDSLMSNFEKVTTFPTQHLIENLEYGIFPIKYFNPSLTSL